MTRDDYETRITELEARLAAAYDSEAGEAITWRHTADTQAEYIIHLEIQLAKVSYAQHWEPVPNGVHRGSDSQMGDITVRDGVVVWSLRGLTQIITLPEGWQLMRHKDATRLEVKFLGSTYGPPDETPEARAARYLETARRHRDTGRLTEDPT